MNGVRKIDICRSPFYDSFKLEDAMQDMGNFTIGIRFDKSITVPEDTVFEIDVTGPFAPYESEWEIDLQKSPVGMVTDFI